MIIEALRQATEGSHELDVMIYKAMTKELTVEQHVAAFRNEYAREPSPAFISVFQNSWQHALDNPPHYTRDIRAAMRLIPAGWIWQISNRAPAPHAGRAYINNGELQLAGISALRRNPAYRGAEATAATPELALCIVCLTILAEDQA